jgi:hypothetical protein
MIFDKECLFFPTEEDYYTFLLFSSKCDNKVQLWTIFDCLNSLI